MLAIDILTVNKMRQQFLCKPFFCHILLRKNQSPSHYIKNGFHQLLQSVQNTTNLTGNLHKLLLNSTLFYKNQTNSLGHDASCKALKESFQNFLCTRNDSDDITIIDLTYGDGNHTNMILENFEKVKVICLDRNHESYEKAKKLSEIDSRVIPIFGKFSDLPQTLNKMNYLFNSIDCMIMDLGISNSQAKSKRGFTVDSQCLLDMRMDPDGITGYQVLAGIDEVSLSKILKTYGEEKFSKKIARAIIETRYTFKKVERTCDLNELVAAVVGTDVRIDPYRQTKEHVAQKVYNGLRRFVNNELNELNYAMSIAEKYLKPHGIVVCMCNSAVEDKVVKRHLMGNAMENCANDMALKFVNHSLTVDSKDLSSLTYTPWTLLDKKVSPESNIKLRVAMKK